MPSVDSAGGARLRTRRVTAADYRDGPLGSFLAEPLIEVADAAMAPIAPSASQAAVFAGYRLQEIADYRAALQGWFAAVREGGHLVVVVPHAFLHDRLDALPSRWNPAQRRLYTPASLLDEVEEALAPNSYRVRRLADDDAGYDYGLEPALPPTGHHDILLVLERIAPPAWNLDPVPLVRTPAPRDRFEPDRTRIERTSLVPRQTILILKLDHLGDFIMSVPALEKARAAFPDAHITLVVGSWNLAMAQELGLFDLVLAFDAFPRNSTEEKVDVPGKTALFEALIVGAYDLAIDLRTDADTRFLLRCVRARLRAGLGTRGQFPFLDIFLPVDGTRHAREAVARVEIPPDAFAAQPACTRNRFQIACDGGRVDFHAGAILWGPFRRLDAGRYLFETFVAVDPHTPGVVGYDVALDAVPVVRGTLTESRELSLVFTTETDLASFEFRLWAQHDVPVPNLQFYGGRLIRQGASSVLHQSEYLQLLVELVAIRVGRDGVLHDEGGAP